MRQEPGAQRPSHEITALELVWRNVWVRALSYVVLLVALVAVLWSLRGGYAFALQVGVIAFVIAYVLNPIVELLQRLRLRRSLAVVLVYVLVLQVAVFFSVLMGQVVVELGRFVNLVPEVVEDIAARLGAVSTWFEGLAERMPPFVLERFGDQAAGEDLAQQFQERLSEVIATGLESVLQLLERLLAEGPGVLVAGATSLISTTFQVLLIVLASAYFLYDFPRFTANVRRFVPVRWRPLHDDLVQKADRAVGGFLRGQILITIVLGIMIWIGLSLIGVPFATAISVLAAIFNLVPYLGPIIGVIPAVLLAFTVSPLAALLTVVVFVVANQVEGNLLGPLILSRSVDLHPVTVLLAISAGLGLLGILGALLAVPVVALVKVLLEDYLLTRPAYRLSGPGGSDPAPSGETSSSSEEASGRS